MKFEFATAQRIIFGEGSLNQIGALAESFGRRVLVVTGAHPERAQPLLDLLAADALDAAIFSAVSYTHLDVYKRQRPSPAHTSSPCRCSPPSVLKPSIPICSSR